jgi:hypothetical protein
VSEPSSPDLRVLAGYVRNKVQKGQTATFMAHGRRVHIIPHTLLTGELPGLLVASDRGESIWVTHDTPLNVITFQAGGFHLRRASLLCNLFKAIRGQPETLVR